MCCDGRLSELGKWGEICMLSCFHAFAGVCPCVYAVLLVLECFWFCRCCREESVNWNDDLRVELSCCDWGVVGVVLWDCGSFRGLLFLLSVNIAWFWCFLIELGVNFASYDLFWSFFNLCCFGAVWSWLWWVDGVVCRYLGCRTRERLSVVGFYGRCNSWFNDVGGLIGGMRGGSGERAEKEQLW